MHRSLCGTQLDETAADAAKPVDKRITAAAACQTLTVGLPVGALLLRYLRNAALNRLIYAVCIHIREQTSFADRHHFSVTAVTEQGGRVICSLPFCSAAGCGTIVTRSGASKSLCA